jgi:hypothetical protein
MTKAGGVAQWGGGTKGKMGRQAKSSPGTRHGGKPTFGVYNPGTTSTARHVDNPLHAPLPPRPSEASALAGICLEDWNDSLLVTR